MKLSADSPEVILQVSNKILNFWQFFWFLCICMLTLLMQKTLFGRTSKLQHAKMHVFGKQKSGFFKMWDTLTMIQLRKKKQLTNLLSPLKAFFDHLQGRWENSIFRFFWEFPFFTMFDSLTSLMCAKSENFKKSIFFDFLSGLASGQKMILGAKEH